MAKKERKSKKKKAPPQMPVHEKEQNEQERLLKKIIPAFAGSGAEKLVDLLYGKQNVNEFLIAEKMGLTINQTRNILYKLSDEGLVEFIRKKDKKKGGWYTYFWTLKTKKILQKYRDELEKEIAKLKQELGQRSHQRIYYSATIDTEYSEEEAMLHDYICPETGEVLQLRDNTPIIGRIQAEVKKVENAVHSVSREISQLGEQESKVLGRKLKAEVKKKEDERKKKKEERIKAAKKIAKISKPKRSKPKPKKKSKKK